ncbi:MAG: substrate-binding domain-containing protein [Spirochaetales bacterium]|nr:substrate-binding domain-containing protein [Spirochaetales bacterium]
MRIGFVLADLFTGSSVTLWPAVAEMFPDNGRDSLVIFSGGRLMSSSPLEKMKNSIYDLVSPDNLDGLIIWCSTLTGDASTDDVIGRFKHMLSRPVVTIAGKTASFPDIPDVRFNAYEGSRALVRHCIEEHHFRRIAYIRGPENHMSSKRRFKAYMDVLAEYGIEYDPDIVSDAAPWSKGAESIRQLLDARGKVPGKDFDVILCASDLMLYSAAQELSARGYEIGRDVYACGFNDSIESRLMNVPVTTVRMPASELGKSAVRSFYDLVSGRPCHDQELPTTPIIRRSCGCHGEKSWSECTSTVALADSVASHFPVSKDKARTVVEKVARNPSEKNVRELLQMLCTEGADLYEITKVINGFMGITGISEANRRAIVSSSKDLLPSVLDRKMSERSYEDRAHRSAFNIFNNELLEANKVAEIAEILSRNAGSLGFDKLTLIVNDGEKSICMSDGTVFSETALFPEGSQDDMFDRGVWIAAPLCTETEDMGYLLMKPVQFNGSVCEQIRSAVSSALRSSILFESTKRAQITAEEAEQARTTFFANVGENLRDPLSEILEIVSSSDLAEDVKKSVIRKITGVNHIIDLSLSTTDELELNKYTVNIGKLLSEFDCYDETMALPCLILDENRIKQAIEIIVSSMGSDVRITASMQRKGIRIDISGKGVQPNDPMDSAGLALAQKIILLHYGTYNNAEGSFSFLLPYPSLSGNPPQVWAEGDVLACINGLPDQCPENVVCEEISGSRFAEKKRLPPFTGAVFWDGSFKGYNALTAIIALVSNSGYRDLPFICMECPRSKTLEDALRTSVEAKGRVILQVGPAPEDLNRWLQDPEIISCELGNAAQMCKRHEPALVLVSVDEHLNKMASVVEFLNSLRNMRMVSQTPVILVSDYIDSSFVGRISDIPNVIAVNTCMLESEEFAMRIRAVLGGSELLSTNTGAIVKKAQAYICTHATLQLSRWQIAEDAHVSEDYLTRVFKKELGLSPWDYLNRYRIWLACSLLKNTGMSVNDVSVATGFLDQAYFCRVFKKIRGFSPSRMRSVKKSELYKK